MIAIVRSLVVLAVAGCGFDPHVGSLDGATLDSHTMVSHDDAHSIDAFAGIAFVQSASGFSSPWTSSSSSIAATFSSAVSAGDLIAVYVSYAGNTSLQGVSDSLGNSYAVVDTVSDDDDTQKSSTAYARNIAAGTDTVTVRLDGGVCCRVVIAHELSGADPNAPLDGHSSHEEDSTGTHTDGVTSGTMTTTAGLDYIFAGTSDGAAAGGQHITAGTGFELRATPAISNGNATASEDETQVAAGAMTSTFTFAANGNALSLQMAFKP
jgi:hypothetical protein